MRLDAHHGGRRTGTRFCTQPYAMQIEKTQVNKSSPPDSLSLVVASAEYHDSCQQFKSYFLNTLSQQLSGDKVKQLVAILHPVLHVGAN